MYKRLIFLSVLLLVGSCRLIAQEIILREIKNYDIGSEIQILIDSTNNLSFEDIQKSENQKKFFQSTQKVPIYGYSEYKFWVKIEIENQSDTERDWILHYAWTSINKFTFYQKMDGKWLGKAMGQGLPHDQKILPYVTYGLPLELPKDEKRTFYILVDSTKPIMFPLSVKPKESFTVYEVTRNILYGLYFGGLLIMLLYNLSIFIFLRDKSYLYYVLIIICTINMFAGLNGFSAVYLWPNMPIINLYIVKIMMTFMVIATILFANSFLESKKYAPFFYHLSKVNMVLAVLALIWTTLNLESYVEHTLLKFHILWILGVGIMAWIRGQKAARFYVLAWIFYIIGGLAVTFSNSGTIPFNFFTRHSVEIGSTLEVILLSIALSDRYRLIRREKEAVTQQLLEKETEAKGILENKVKERTISLQEANEELQQINEELNITLETVSLQKEEIEQQKELILSSINYAKRIQDAILPKLSEIQTTFPESFVFFKPRDIVSGDFYFYAQKGHKSVIAAIDCTGHGIPGAFMSLIGNDLLHEIVINQEVIEPNIILEKLHLGVRSLLRQKETKNREGMDMSLVVVDIEKDTLEFAGAKNSLLYIQNQELKFIKGDKTPIGGEQRETERKFTKHQIKLDRSTAIYLFSDGIQDQFGGKDNRKFSPKQLRELLLKNHQKPISEQKEILEQTIEKWRQEGREAQIDDMLLIGVIV